ncbi:MAG: 6-carboxytetrahydropterin synthase [Acaryochloridaceae cyanobacterium SU_2_1]|nr:6-carboxytetrahydropterin synthase [Acaryochloridaceae cyanobacterium SU_2_1]
MNCVIHRRAEFSASHRYWLPELPESVNQEQFGLFTQAPGHGHNYVLYVSLRGELDQYGMVLNLSDLKKIIHQEITSQLNLAYLNDVWPEFTKTLPTTEHLAQVIWQRLANQLPLVNIQLFEHPQLWAEYKGAGMEAYLTVGSHFSAAHRLALNNMSYEENCAIYGKCARPHGHGHNYHLEVTVKGQINPRTGMIVDLVALQKLVEEIILEPLDHTFLNKDIPYFADIVPTAENIAIYIAQLLNQPIHNLGAELHRIKLIESPNNSCEVLCSDLPNSSSTFPKLVSEPALVG